MKEYIDVIDNRTGKVLCSTAQKMSPQEAQAKVENDLATGYSSAIRTHGRDCCKATHVGGGYLHSEKDDSPYDVDGVLYCGRCHGCLQ